MSKVIIEQTLLFDQWTFRLTKLDGERIDLSYRLGCALERLVRNRGGMVARAELHEALWPGQIMTDWALSKVVADLRAVLARVGLSNVVETAYGRGFLFTGDLEDVETSEITRVRESLTLEPLSH